MRLLERLPAYWTLRYDLWRLRERLAVRLILSYLRDLDRLYIHRDEDTGSIAVVMPIREYWLHDLPRSDKHEHIEG